MFSKTWWSMAGKRAVRTMAQVVVTTFGTDMLIPDIRFNVQQMAVLILGSGVLSICTSIAFGLPENDDPTDPRIRIE